MSDVSLDDFAAAHSTGAAQVIDVREPAEYVTGHVPGAASIPMGQLPDRLAEIDREPMRDLPSETYEQLMAEKRKLQAELNAIGKPSWKKTSFTEPPDA